MSDNELVAEDNTEPELVEEIVDVGEKVDVIDVEGEGELVPVDEIEPDPVCDGEGDRVPD